MEAYPESDTMLDQMFFKVCDSFKGYDAQLNENFKNLSTNFERFRFIWCPSIVHADIDRLLTEKKYYDPKDAVKSAQYRQQGNDEFKRFKFRESLMLYTQSIRFAINPKIKPSKDTSAAAAAEYNEDLALAYANRSAAFYQLDQFECCLNDIESSLKYGYPEKGRDKLYERKLHCLYKLERFNDILQIIKGIKEINIDMFRVYEQKLAQLNISLDSPVKQNIKEKLSLMKTIDGKLSCLKFTISDEERNAKIENASNKICMDYSVNEGFHFKASEDAKVGELIIDEPPYASVLLADNIKHNCFECMKPLDQFKMNFTYCPQCTFVTYCSKLKILYFRRKSTIF